MASIKICDRCRNIVPDSELGSSKITSGIVYDVNGGTRDLRGDMCAECTAQFLARDYVKGRHFKMGELADKESPPQNQGEWQPPTLDETE